MATRTSKSTVTFRKPFVLEGFEEMLPAGVYSIETDEELLEGISFPAYRRVLTLIHLPATPSHPGVTRTLTIDHKELDQALQRDQALTEVPDGHVAGQQGLSAALGASPDSAARPAIERGEDEGMPLFRV